MSSTRVCTLAILLILAIILHDIIPCEGAQRAAHTRRVVSHRLEDTHESLAHPPHSAPPIVDQVHSLIDDTTSPSSPPDHQPTTIVDDDASFDRMSEIALAQWKIREYGKRVDTSAVMSSIGDTAPLVWSHGQNAYTMTRPEGVRQYYLWVPSSYVANASAAYTLIVALHGLGDEPVNFATATNLTQMADAESFFLLYPAGSMGLLGTGWNAGTCCVDESVDDIGFISSIVSLVNSTFPIRADSIHSMGFSNGAFMTESLGCHLSPIFRSIASVSGDVVLVWGGEAALAACDAVFTSTASILHIHGTDDPLVLFNGEPFLGWPGIPDDMNAWAKRNACPSHAVQTLNVSTFNNYVFEGCGASGDVQVELVINEGGMHQYPMIPGVFDTSQYILDFWNRVTPNGIAVIEDDRHRRVKSIPITRFN